jgi:soluble cytochrome b562
MSEQEIDQSPKKDRVFSAKELQDFSKGFMELALEGIDAGNLEKARYWCRRQVETHDGLHDAFIDTITAFFSYIYDKAGEDTAVDAMREVMGKGITPEFIAIMKQQKPESRVRELVDLSRHHIASQGHIVEEDEEKFTMILQCSSGGRLIANGAYEGPNGFRKLRKAGPYTWGEVDVPIYCSHCAWRHEFLPIKVGGQGSQTIVHASPFPKKPGDPCVHLIYKNPDDIPEEYYKRLGLEKTRGRMTSEKQISPSSKPKRVFSTKELQDFSKGFMELALEGIDAGDLEKAKYWCRHEANTHDGFYDVLVNFAVELLSYIYDKLGEETVVDAMHKVIGKGITPESIAIMKQQKPEGRVRDFVDVWRQHYTNPGLILEEDDEKFTIKVKCGSGGKLIEKGAYEGPNGFRKLRKAGPHTWGEVDVPIYCSVCAWRHEVLPIEIGGQGSQTIVHASPFPKKPGDPCVHLIYKNPDDIPEKHYKRLGLTKMVK